MRGATRYSLLLADFTVVPTNAAWSFIAALGASYIVAGIALGVVGPLLQWVLHVDEFVNAIFYGPRNIGLSGIDIAATLSVATTLAAIAAITVARKSDGRWALVLYAAFVLFAATLAITRAIDFERITASHPGFYVLSVLDMPLGAAITFLPAAIVVILGLVMPVQRRVAATGSNNAVLECAGVYALAGVIATFALLSPQNRDLLFGPYLLTSLDAAPHALVVVAQAILAGLTYALRSRIGVTRTAVLVLFAVGVAAALPTDLTPIGLALFAGWSYVPLSLVIVPVLTVLVVVAISLARHGTSRHSRNV